MSKEREEERKGIDREMYNERSTARQKRDRDKKTVTVITRGRRERAV